MSNRAKSLILRYGSALLCVALAVALRRSLDQILGDKIPYAMLFLAVMIAAWSGGFGPALVATLLGAFASARFLLHPRDSFAVEGFDNQAGMALYLISGFGIALFGGAMRRAQRRAEEKAHELSRAEVRLQVTLRSIGDAVISTDAEGRVAFLNPVAEQLTGWSQQEALGKSLLEIFRIVNESTRKPVDNPALRALKEGVIVGLANHTILIAKDGTERFIDDSAAPIRVENGETLGAVLVCRDISERKRADQRERLLLKQAATANAKFRAFFDQGTIFSGILDLNGVIIDPNRLCYEGCGYSREQILGNAFWNGPWWSPSPALVQRIKTAFRQARAGQTFREEIAYFVADGSERMVDFTMLPIKDETGQIVNLAATGLDITERKLAEQQLRESEERFRTLFDSMEEAFCVVDMLYDAAGIRPIDYRFLEANPTFEKHTGFKNAVGRTIRELVPDHDAHWFETFGAVASTGKPIRFMNEAKAMGRWYDVYAHRVGGPDTRKVGILFTDITARKQAEDDLRQMAATLSEADHRKNEFLATLAHELRNPLAPIRNGLELMRLSSGNGAIMEDARSMMERQLAQMARLIDDLMDISRISRGKIELRSEKSPLAAIVQSAVETSRPLIKEMGHELTVTLPEQPLLVDADPTRLAQVFMNLLNNAAKYSERGSHILLTAEQQGGEVKVTVKDSGIGIAADQLLEIFELFSQVDRSLEKSQGGLGIGLTLVKRLVEMHGGKIEAHSAGSGQGSEFVVSLPVAAPACDPQFVAGEKPVLAKSSLRILIVDDNRDSADTLAVMLKVMGNETHTAYDGEETVSAATALQPDVILLDIGMPKLNGYEACRRIREQSCQRRPVIIAQTGWGQQEDRQRTREAGFDHHLVKPVDPTALMRLLAKISETSAT